MENYSSNDLNAILAQATKPKTNTETKLVNDELFKKYFSPRIDTKSRETSAIFKGRIIPNPEGGSPFKVVKFHWMKIYGKWQMLPCLDEFGETCPICEAYQGLTASGKKDDAKIYRPTEFYIVRMLDRSREEDGVTFWRFKKDYNGQGEFDKIVNLINMEIDVLDPINGYDLNIMCGKNDKNKSVIQSILHKAPSRLAETDEQIKDLINDPLKWTDVYRPKEKSYMEDVVAGRAQYWSHELKRYVRPGEENINVEETILTNNDINFDQKIEDKILGETPTINAEKPKVVDVDKTILDGDDDDLPF